MARRLPTGSEFGPLHEMELSDSRETFSGNGTRNDRVFHASTTLWAHRNFLGAILLRSALLVALVALLLPATYESKTELMPPDQQSGAASMLAALMGGGGGSATSSLASGGPSMSSGVMGMASDLLGLKTSGALFISILSSDAVQDKLIDRFDLRGEYWVSTYAAARKKLAARTDFEEDKKSGVITVRVQDHDPNRAAALAAAYVDELNHMVADLNTSAAHRERLFLEERLSVVKQELDRSSKEFSEFSSTHSTLDLKTQGQAMVQAAATLRGQEIAAQAELRGLEQIYTPYNVRVKEVKARIGELQHQLEKLGGVATQPEPDIEKGEDLYPSIRQLPVLGVTFTDLYRRLRINETVFETLTKEYELARVQEAKEVPSVKVLVPAQRPERRHGPPRLLIFLGGTLLSIVLGSAWVLGRDVWENIAPGSHRKRFVEEVADEINTKLRLRRARELSEQIAGRFRPAGTNGSNNSENGHRRAS
jgi:uncharacterized protein involved in exopolysaccharide biosynthesis